MRECRPPQKKNKTKQNKTKKQKHDFRGGGCEEVMKSAFLQILVVLKAIEIIFGS